MAFELVTKPHLGWVRTLSPAEDRALRAVKAGEADEEQQAVCLAMLNAARDADRWILCDCQEEEGQQAVIVPVRRTRSHFALSNRPDTEGAACGGLPVRPRQGRRRGRRPVFRLRRHVRSVHGRREACRRARPGRRRTGGGSRGSRPAGSRARCPACWAR